MSLPTSPVLLLAQGYQHGGELVTVGQARQDSGARAPGLVLDWGHNHAEGVDTLGKAAAPLTPILALPGADTDKYGKKKFGRYKATAPWIQRDVPKTAEDWELTIQESLVAQSSLPLDAVMLPTRPITGTDWPDDFQVLADVARRAWTNLDLGPTPFITLKVSEPWVTERKMRRTLLNQLTDLPAEFNVAIDVLWNSMASYTDESVLHDLATVVSALSNDNRKVLLLDSGLIGWLSIAWGAWGLSAGISNASWFRQNAVIRRAKGQPGPPRIKRYFEKQLLTRVRQAQHVRLKAESGYQACGCPFCVQLGPDSVNPWDFVEADKHALFGLAALTDEISAPGLAERANRVRKCLDDAIAYNKSLPFELPGDSKPVQLEAWRSVV